MMPLMKTANCYNFRFNTGTNLVVHAPKHHKKKSSELQLPSMSLLTTKASSQQFLLRMLKVILQLREAARTAAKEANKKDKKQPGELVKIDVIDHSNLNQIYKICPF